MVERVIATAAALELIAQLKAEYGEIMFHQSGGCCDNSAANCYLPTDLTIGPYDVKLGELDGVPFYIGKQQYEYWKHTQLILDVNRRPWWHLLPRGKYWQSLSYALATIQR